MEKKRAEITICMGSSCFSRGNRRMIQTIQQFLKTKNLAENVILRGAHCMGKCEQGPVMKLDDQIVYLITSENLEETLENYFKSDDLK
jgi:NADH:ubiquinone oxidoreductase subunit E